MKVTTTDGKVVNLNDFIFPKAPGGEAKLSSRHIAKYFGKLHKNVLRDIGNLDCSLKFTRLNFERSKYIDPSGKKNDEILMTKDGCLFLIMGYTGTKSASIKEQLITKFRQAEDRIRRLELKHFNSDLRRRDTLHKAFNDNKTHMRKIRKKSEVEDLASKFGVH